MIAWGMLARLAPLAIAHETAHVNDALTRLLARGATHAEIARQTGLTLEAVRLLADSRLTRLASYAVREESRCA